MSEKFSKLEEKTQQKKPNKQIRYNASHKSIWHNIYLHCFKLSECVSKRQVSKTVDKIQNLQNLDLIAPCQITEMTI